MNAVSGQLMKMSLKAINLESGKKSTLVKKNS